MFILFVDTYHLENNVELCDELERLLGTKSRREIDEHVEWHDKYTNLNELKKQAIKKWRDTKLVSPRMRFYQSLL